MFSLHLVQKGHPSKFIIKSTIFNELFNVRAPAGGTARKAREAQKENQHSTQKTPQKQRNHNFFSTPRAKPPKKHVKTAKKAPPGGHNDPQERPRRGRERPKRSQDDPKSAPRAAQRRSQSTKRLPDTSGEPFWPPRGWILAPSEAPSPAQLKPP